MRKQNDQKFENYKQLQLMYSDDIKNLQTQLAALQKEHALSKQEQNSLNEKLQHALQENAQLIEIQDENEINITNLMK